MKVSIPAEGPDLDAKVRDRLGLLPVMISVVFLVGLFTAFISKDFLVSV